MSDVHFCDLFVGALGPHSGLFPDAQPSICLAHIACADVLQEVGTIDKPVVGSTPNGETFLTREGVLYTTRPARVTCPTCATVAELYRDKTKADEEH